MTAGYSETPLAKKSGIKEEYSVLLYLGPKHYFKLFSELPKNLLFQEKAITENTGFIHLFCKSYGELKEIGEAYKKALKKWFVVGQLA